jgi:hypothetical protein
LVLIFLGPATLPDLAQGFGPALHTQREPRFGDGRSWRRSEWLLVIAVSALAATALALSCARG